MGPEVFRRATILTGPTASGKSAFALRLAERLRAEIVCMDSMTLYRGMDIGTAKPTPAERARVPHHLLDVLDPSESASVAWWLAEAAGCVRAIESRGLQVLIVGGTPLYLKALLHGLFEGPPVDPALRRRLEQEAAMSGSAVLHARLVSVDPATARRLHVNDVRRIVRALEVYEQTGRPMSAWQQQWRQTTEPVDLSQGPRCFCLLPPRTVLYDRINRRTRAMIAGGWIDEARALRDRPLSREAAQAVGYRELFEHLAGQTTLDAAIERIQRRTRQLARRQLTWFRALPECRPLSEDLTRTEWGLTMNGAPTGD
jgi:tRNA dimethylallyltransferase